MDDNTADIGCENGGMLQSHFCAWDRSKEVTVLTCNGVLACKMGKTASWTERESAVRGKRT